MSKKTLEEKVDELTDYIVGAPLKNIPGVHNQMADVLKHIQAQDKRIERLENGKADKFDWKKLFSIFAKAKPLTP